MLVWVCSCCSEETRGREGKVARKKGRDDALVMRRAVEVIWVLEVLLVVGVGLVVCGL